MKILAALCMGLAGLAALADDLPETTAKSDSVAPADEEFKPPPGFKAKKRGELVLYCIRDSTVGTRFKTEKCYNEAQIRDYLVAQQENKRDIDRVRNTCSTGAGEYCVRP